jgi:hypothetical protein
MAHILSQSLSPYPSRYMYVLCEYSEVPNRRSCSLRFLDFFPPCSQIFSLLAYKIQEKFPACSFIPSCLFNKILPCFFTIDHFDHNLCYRKLVILCFIHSAHLIQSDFPPLFNMYNHFHPVQ